MDIEKMELAKLILSGNYKIDIIEHDDNGDFFHRIVEEWDVSIELAENENIVNKCFGLFPPEDEFPTINDVCCKLQFNLIPSNDNMNLIDNIELYDSTVLGDLKTAYGNVECAKPSYFNDKEYNFEYFGVDGLYAGKYRGYIELDDLEESAQELNIPFNDNTNIEDLSQIIIYAVLEEFEMNYYGVQYDSYEDFDIYYIPK